MKSLKILLSVVLVLSSYSIAQISSKKVDKLVKEAMETFNVPGVAVGIVKDGIVIHNKGYGVKSVETNEPIDEHTNFVISSNTKAFTTTALAILVDEGKLSWDDKVIDIIPEFKMYNEYVTQNFNIIDLLTHRSGLGLGAGDLMTYPDGGDFSMADFLSVFQYFEPKSAFRTKYDYDNVLYKIASEVIARISGMNWEVFIKERIMNPINMDNSYGLYSQIPDKHNLAMPHTYDNDQLKTISHREKRLFGGSGGAFSNVDDMCNWMLVLLNKGKYGSDIENQLFSEENHKKMWTIHTVYKSYSSDRYKSNFAGYGLGWGLSDLNGEFLVSHTGGNPGMMSRVTLLPDLNLGVIVLVNSDLGWAVYNSVTRTVVDNYLKLDELDWIENYKERVEQYNSKGDSVTINVWEVVELAKEIEINFDDYIGIYEDNWFGKVEVFTKENQLWFKSYRSPKLNGPMHYYKANAFAIKWEYQDANCDAFAIFSLDEEGKVQSIKMKGISPNIDFSFDFQDLDLIRIKE